MRIELPDFCLVALVGVSGSGKSTFADRHFRSTEVLGSDFFRAMVSDDANNQDASQAAFDSLYYVAAKRLEDRRLTVIDATNVQGRSRESILRLAKEHNCQTAAIVLDLPLATCISRNDSRGDRDMPASVIKGQHRDLQRSINRLGREGFRHVYVLRTADEVEKAEIVRVPLRSDMRHETGGFDVIGDVHGCYDELCHLLEKLGYLVDRESCRAQPPEGRRAVFLGDLCDRGPENVKVLRLVMSMVEENSALCLIGNHDNKLMRWLRGSRVTVSHGIDITIRQMEEAGAKFSEKVLNFLDGLMSHYVLDEGRLVVAHAGIREKYQGRASGRVRSFCLYGDTTGETDEYGLPVRLNWAENYRGKALVVYGHMAAGTVQRLNNTICLDTGCVFGGRLTALRYPEGEIVDVSAARVYYEPVNQAVFSGDAVPDERMANLLDISDVTGKRRISTQFYRDIVIPEENTYAALEVMGRFAIDPRWMIYLPPTMSPPLPSQKEGYLEHPLEAFEYYKRRGTRHLICEQKHMGSRAIIIVCRNAETAAKRFGVEDGDTAVIYTRSGRPFFTGSDEAAGNVILERLCRELERTRFWEDFSTDWVCLDAEVMPWSAKGHQLLREQYSPVGYAGRHALANAAQAIEQALSVLSADAGTGNNAVDLDGLLASFRQRSEALAAYTEAYRHYCWSVDSVDDYRIAPFHVLATEGRVWHDTSHPEQMEVIRTYTTGDALFMATEYLSVDLDDPESVASAVAWWEDLTASGGEGMVVKPVDFVVRTERTLLQPAIKCRGREYLRIIYGPEYDEPGRLQRLRSRSVATKGRLALSEFALGLEALERFVKGEPLYRVHECVFGILALESEAVDPGL